MRSYFRSVIYNISISIAFVSQHSKVVFIGNYYLSCQWVKLFFLPFFPHKCQMQPNRAIDIPLTPNKGGGEERMNEKPLLLNHCKDAHRLKIQGG